ncbi:TolB family protein [Motilibacter aurantiacus]|uniref:TolB family protein n=1 Tax=Motilibacter aurantiacus TaxID=2714955 RepID=UPI001408AFC9|nr:hypothetical protein [Motilibacter aurantiacus]NHC44429.1 hypothetical protein [Motilibacter aurantiacus]
MISADGSRLAWVRCAEGEALSSISVFTFATRQLQEVALRGDELHSQWLLRLQWSPDGTAIAVTEGNSAAVVELATGQLTTPPPGFGFKVAWSPDSSRIAVEEAQSGGFGVGVFDRDLATHVTVEVPEPASPFQQAGWTWSADGTSVATAASDRSGRWYLLRAPVDGGASTRTELSRPPFTPAGDNGIGIRGWTSEGLVVSVIGQPGSPDTGNAGWFTVERPRGRRPDCSTRWTTQRSSSCRASSADAAPAVSRPVIVWRGRLP